MVARVILADDHSIFRSGLRALLERETGISVVGEADNGLAAVQLASDLSPDVGIMDVNMPHSDGIAATRAIHTRNPATKVIALSCVHTNRFVCDMLDAGASAYVAKESAFDQLTIALHEVLAGRSYLSPGLTPEIEQGDGL